MQSIWRFEDRQRRALATEVFEHSERTQVQAAVRFVAGSRRPARWPSIPQPREMVVRQAQQPRVQPMTRDVDVLGEQALEACSRRVRKRAQRSELLAQVNGTRRTDRGANVLRDETRFGSCVMRASFA